MISSSKETILANIPPAGIDAFTLAGNLDESLQELNLFLETFPELYSYETVQVTYRNKYSGRGTRQTYTIHSRFWRKK